MNAPFNETVISGQKGISINAVVEDTDFDGEFGRKMSRAISIVSVDDEKVTSEKDLDEPKDDEIEKLMQRIQKQRSALDEILGHEAKHESVTVEAKTAKVDVVSEEVEEEVELPDINEETEVQEEEKEPEGKEVPEEKVKEPEKKLVKEVETEKVEEPEGSLINFLQIFINFLKLE